MLGNIQDKDVQTLNMVPQYQILSRIFCQGYLGETRKGREKSEFLRDAGAHAKIGKGIMKSVTAGIISVILAWCSSKISPVVAL